MRPDKPLRDRCVDRLSAERVEERFDCLCVELLCNEDLSPASGDEPSLDRLVEGTLGQGSVGGAQAGQDGGATGRRRAARTRTHRAAPVPRSASRDSTSSSNESDRRAPGMLRRAARICSAASGLPADRSTMAASSPAEGRSPVSASMKRSNSSGRRGSSSICSTEGSAASMSAIRPNGCRRPNSSSWYETTRQIGSATSSPAMNSTNARVPGSAQ